MSRKVPLGYQSMYDYDKNEDDRTRKQVALVQMIVATVIFFIGFISFLAIMAFR